MRKVQSARVVLGLLVIVLTTLTPLHRTLLAGNNGQGMLTTGQSPIDIPKSVLKIRKLPDMVPIYHSGDVLDQVCLEIKNGERVYATPPALEAVPQVVTKIAPRKNNFLRVGKKIFEPISFHWHTPSEHLVNGRQAAMELHIVHEEVLFNEIDFVKNRPAQQLIAAVLYVEGEENRAIASIFTRFGSFGQQQCIDVGTFDLEALLPARGSRTTFRYLGSSTESDEHGVFRNGVLWIVFSETMTASVQQVLDHRDLVEGPLSAFPFVDAKTALRPKPLVGNTRAVQGLAGRTLLTDLWPKPGP